MKAGPIDFKEKLFENEVPVAALKSRLDQLTERERQMLAAVVAGLPNRTIGYDLAISPRTVEIYCANIMSKNAGLQPPRTGAYDDLAWCRRLSCSHTSRIEFVNIKCQVGSVPKQHPPMAEDMILIGSKRSKVIEAPDMIEQHIILVAALGAGSGIPSNLPSQTNDSGSTPTAIVCQ